MPAVVHNGDAMKRLIRLPEVTAMTGLSRSEIYRLEAINKFPKRVPLTERTTTWDADEVQEWVKAKIAAREAAAEERAASAGRRLTATRFTEPRAA
jgi:prophage regulatory protein